MRYLRELRPELFRTGLMRPALRLYVDRGEVIISRSEREGFEWRTVCYDRVKRIHAKARIIYVVFLLAFPVILRYSQRRFPHIMRVR
jgi:hypothetical protein